MNSSGYICRFQFNFKLGLNPMLIIAAINVTILYFFHPKLILSPANQRPTGANHDQCSVDSFKHAPLASIAWSMEFPRLPDHSLHISTRVILKVQGNQVAQFTKRRGSLPGPLLCASSLISQDFAAASKQRQQKKKILMLSSLIWMAPRRRDRCSKRMLERMN